MNTNPLPPELVEQYEKVIDEFDDSESIFRILHLKTKCAHSPDKWCISCYESKKDTIIGIKKHEDGKG